MKSTPAKCRKLALSRAVCLIALLLATSDCGPQNTPILITLLGDMTEVESLRITPTLDGRKGKPIVHDPKQGQRVLWFPEEVGGTLTLEAETISSSPTKCSSRARAEVAFEPESTHPIEVTLDFALARPRCQLTVELQGMDTVTSQPAGLDCHGVVTCRGWFARDEQVTLKVGNRPSGRYGQWTGCEEVQGATCKLTIRGHVALQVEDRRGICSDGDWCWQNALPQGNELQAVWGADTANVWAVGAAGTILKWQGDIWTSQFSGTTNTLAGVWGTDAANVWAVGAAGTILKGDYDHAIRTYTDSRMEMSCRLPGSPTSAMIATLTRVMSDRGARSDTSAYPPTCKPQMGCLWTLRLPRLNNTALYTA